MAFSTQCTHKSCGQLTTPYLDNDTIYCSFCDQPLTHLTSFVKNQMKVNKQFKVKTPAAFAVKCSSCNKDDKPILKGNDIVCSKCFSPLKLSEPFKIMLREKLKTSSDI